MKRIFVCGAVALASCSATPTDPAKGPVVLQCDGDKTTIVFGSETSEARSTFRVDGLAQKLEVWNPEKSEWAVWGTEPTLAITADRIRYSAVISGDGAAARRMIEFDRVAGTVVDTINLMPMGTVIFRGSCEPVASPSKVPLKF